MLSNCNTLQTLLGKMSKSLLYHVHKPARTSELPQSLFSCEWIEVLPLGFVEIECLVGFFHSSCILQCGCCRDIVTFLQYYNESALFCWGEKKRTTARIECVHQTYTQSQRINRNNILKLRSVNSFTENQNAEALLF